MGKKLTGILLFAIMILALGVRLIGLDRCFVIDEYRTIEQSRRPIKGLFQRIETESYPPLSFLALWVWMRISQRDIWIRFLFVLFGMFSVVIIYLIGKELVNSKYALIAAFLASLTPMQVWVSQYVRGISPAIFFLLLDTLFFIRLIKNKNYNLNAAGYVASTIMAIYSFYFAFFIIAVQNVIYIISNRNKIKSIFKWLLLQIILFILFLPWLITGFLKQIKDANIIANYVTVASRGFNIGRLQIGSYIRATSGLLGLDEVFLINTPIAKILSNNMLLFIAIIFSLAIICFIYLLITIYKRTSKKEIVILFSSFSFTPLILSVILNILFRTPITPRYFAISSAFSIFVYALILFVIKNKKVFYSILIIFMAVSFLRLSDFTKTIIDYKSSSEFINNNIKEGECLLFIEGDRAYEHYSPLPKNYISSASYIKKYIPETDYSLQHLINKENLYLYLKPFEIIWIYHSGEKMIGKVQYVRNLIERCGYKIQNVYKFKNLEIFKYAL